MFIPIYYGPPRNRPPGRLYRKGTAIPLIKRIGTRRMAEPTVIINYTAENVFTEVSPQKWLLGEAVWWHRPS